MTLSTDNLASIAADSGTSVPRVRAAALVVQGDRVLLVEHEKNGQSYWLLPGGGVDWGERLSETLVREVQEETGLTVSVSDLVLATDAIAPDGARHMIQLCFRCEIVSGQIEASQDPRVVGASYVPLDELSTMDLRPPIADAIKSAVQGADSHTVYTGPAWAERTDG